jgi:hypothetical protein
MLPVWTALRNGRERGREAMVVRIEVGMTRNRFVVSLRISGVFLCSFSRGCIVLVPYRTLRSYHHLLCVVQIYHMSHCFALSHGIHCTYLLYDPAYKRICRTMGGSTSFLRNFDTADN